MENNLQISIDRIVVACQNLQASPVLEIDLWSSIAPHLDQILTDKEYFVMRINEVVADKNELLHVLDQVCKFPDYFGFNWDALADSLADFHWQPARGYILMFEELNSLEDNARKVFMEIVQDVSSRWAHRGIPFKLLTSTENSNLK